MLWMLHAKLGRLLVICVFYAYVCVINLFFTKITFGLPLYHTGSKLAITSKIMHKMVQFKNIPGQVIITAAFSSDHR